MKYRHAFHAGNFADVHKHVTLLALLRVMQRKDSGFLYLDTHAGRGLYDLGAEARHGITALRNAVPPATAEIQDYLQAVAAHDELHRGQHTYPGSPLLAAQLLRTQDRGICCELQPPECRALERALPGQRRMRAECADGWRQIAAHLPPIERRALVLIDPPYESGPQDLQLGLQAIGQTLQRLASAVIALWYPIKDERTLQPWLGQVATTLSAPVLQSELWLHPRDSQVALNGSGLLLVNPPYQMDQRMASWLPELGQSLSASSQGGTAQRWLINEPT